MENGAVLRYKVYYPGGNTTALAEAPKGNGLASIAKRIMKLDPDIEQVGFVYPSANSAFKLQMMGGEFCVNAARSAAYDWFLNNSGDEVEFEVSGLEHLVKARITNSKLSLHLPKALVLSITEVPEGHLVEMEGISFVVSGSEVGEELIKKYQTGVPALGVINVLEKDELLSIRANVWVRETDSLVCESGCGSGSIAAFVARNGFGKIGWVQQPSGYQYAVDTRGDDEIIISGVVESKGEREVVVEIFEHDYATF